jgi:16S rRNA processing protein RimM
LLQVFKGKTEILIPILDTMIVSVDRNARVIHTNVPDGLVEMYTNPEKNEDRDV